MIWSGNANSCWPRRADPRSELLDVSLPTAEGCWRFVAPQPRGTFLGTSYGSAHSGAMRIEDCDQLLTAAQEQDLARTIEAGVLAGHLLQTGERPVRASEEELSDLVALGQAAWRRFLLANTRLVRKLANREARRTGLDPEEMFQEGFLALAEALRRYDPGRSRFSTYATLRVTQHLSEVAASRLGELWIPKSRAVQLRRARGLAAALGQERGHEVDAVELATELKRPAAWVAALLSHRGAAPSCGGETLDLPEPAPIDFDEGILRGQIRRAVASLPRQEAEVIGLRFGLTTSQPVSTTGVAALLGISRSRVRRVEHGALARLRPLIGSLDPGDDPEERPAFIACVG